MWLCSTHLLGCLGSSHARLTGRDRPRLSCPVGPAFDSSLPVRLRVREPVLLTDLIFRRPAQEPYPPQEWCSSPFPAIFFSKREAGGRESEVGGGNERLASVTSEQWLPVIGRLSCYFRAGQYSLHLGMTNLLQSYY